MSVVSSVAGVDEVVVVFLLDRAFNTIIADVPAYYEDVLFFLLGKFFLDLSPWHRGDA